MTRRLKPQAELFTREQEARCLAHADLDEPEDLSFYLRVIFLRRAGMRVYRHGVRQHTVDGRIMTTRQLVQLANRSRFSEKA